MIYEGPPLVDHPVLPVMVWGAAYDLDLVLVSRHPAWNMHEYARMQTPDGALWLAKDSRESTLEQSVVIGLDDVHEWFPELPVERKAAPVEVVDRSTEDWLDLDLRYENIDGEPVEVHYQGKPPVSRQRKRNGSTMGHSRDAVLAVLDLPLRNFGRRATISISGEEVGVERILGLIPFRMALVQAQGGLASGQFHQRSGPDGALQTVHEVVPGKPAVVDWTWSDDQLVQRSPIRTLIYAFTTRPDGARELVRAEVQQFARTEPVTVVAFDPALPDLRRRFAGVATSRFSVDMNGQPGHATGTVRVFWEDQGPVVEVLPTDPWWTTDRPLRGTFSWVDGEIYTDIRVVRDEGSSRGR